jgi:hypothetical protein
MKNEKTVVPFDPIRAKWNSALTDRERFNRQMHFQSVDRCFNMEFGFWRENFAKWDIFVKHGITGNGEADTFFGMDRIEASGPGNVWLNPCFKHEIIEDRGDTHVVRNGDGLLAVVPADGHDTIPHYIKSSIENPNDWQRVKEERLRRDDPHRMVDIEKLKREHPEDRDYPVGIGCGSMIGKIRNLLTFEGLAFACFDYPEMVEDMVETSCLLVEDMLDQVLPHFQFDYACGWEDICYKSGPLVSLNFFANVVVPRYRRIGRKLKKHGIDIWYTDTDGDIRLLVPHFMDVGLNTMFPWEVNGSGHPDKFLREFEGAIHVMGGVDKIQLIAGKEATKRYLETLAPWVEKGGFIPFCDHRCPPDVTPENYLYYLDLKREMFGM